MSSTLLRRDTRHACDIHVRRPERADTAAVAALFFEMQVHYNLPVAHSLALEAAELACKPVTSAFDPRVLIALADDMVVGSAVLNVTFPAHELSRALYIRDLYVEASMRRRGVGQTLVKAAVMLAADEGFSALDWTADTANLGARRMYEGCGARLLHRSYYRLTKDDLIQG